MAARERLVTSEWQIVTGLAEEVRYWAFYDLIPGMDQEFHPFYWSGRTEGAAHDQRLTSHNHWSQPPWQRLGALGG